MVSPLSVDDKSFLLEAIQLLCRSLTPEIAIAGFYEHIARFLPLHSFSLLSAAPEHLHPGELIHVAHVSDAGCHCPMSKMPLSEEAKRLAKKTGLDDRGTFTEKLVTSTEDTLFVYLHSLLPQMHPPLFVLRLKKEQPLGTAHFTGHSVFTERHLALMRALEAPLCIAMGNLLQHNELETIKSNILNDNTRLRRELQGLSTVDIIGEHHGLQQVMRKVRQVAPVDVPVLITGETGSGKELIAKAVHELSARRAKPCITVNCGALPPTLIDSELFGFARGSFTGASENRKGYFEQAHGGTLFLDEIGELPLEAQARLLRVLETHEINKIGGSTPLKLDIRLVAATNRDLQKMVCVGSFRQDLYFRLRVIHINVPPLRERTADIPALVQFLLHRSAARFGLAVPSLAEGELHGLLTRPWPGNIRELQNVIEEALVCSGGRPLHFEGSFLEHAADTWGAALRNERQNELQGAWQSEVENKLQSELESTRRGTLETKDSALELLSYKELLHKYFATLLHRTSGRISGPHGAAVRAGLKPGTFRFKCVQLGVLP